MAVIYNTAPEVLANIQRWFNILPQLPPQLQIEFRELIEAYKRTNFAYQRRTAERNIIQFLNKYSEYVYNELNYERTLPDQQAANAEAAGLSRGAALQGLSGYGTPQAMTGQTEYESVPNPNPLDVLQGVFSTIGNVYGIADSATRLGVDLQTAFADLTMKGLGIREMQRDEEGTLIANKFQELLGHAKETELYKQDPSKYQSVSQIEQLFSDLSTGGVETDTAYGQFYNDYVATGRTQNPYVRSKLIPANELESSNIGYAERMQNLTTLSGIDAQKAAQDLQNAKAQYDVIKKERDKKIAEITLLEQDYENAIKQGVLLDTQNLYYNARTGYVWSQTRFQNLLNRAQKCDTMYKESTCEYLTAMDMLDMAKSIARVMAKDKDGNFIQLQTELNNDHIAYLWSCLANDGAVATQDFWNANPELFKLYSAYSHPIIQNGLQSLAEESDLGSRTYSTGLDFGIVKMKRERLTNQAAYMSALNARSSSGQTQKALEIGNEVLNSQGLFEDFWKGNKSGDFFAPQPWQTQNQE